jgi:hypothetical protein
MVHLCGCLSLAPVPVSRRAPLRYMSATVDNVPGNVVIERCCRIGACCPELHATPVAQANLRLNRAGETEHRKHKVTDALTKIQGLDVVERPRSKSAFPHGSLRLSRRLTSEVASGTGELRTPSRYYWDLNGPTQRMTFYDINFVELRPFALKPVDESFGRAGSTTSTDRRAERW